MQSNPTDRARAVVHFMSTFYAVFQEPAKARLAAMALINQGVPTDDISLVARGDETAFGKPPLPDETASQPLADATDFVGRNDDPVIDNLIRDGSPTASQYAVVESPYGGGISTSTSDSASPTVDESDDSQWLSESEDGTTEEEREFHDLNIASNTGFATTATARGLQGMPRSEPIDDIDRSFEAIDIPGFGVVMGTGALATAALDYGDGDPSDDVEVMMKHFTGEGVPQDAAKDYLQALDSGSALLAVGLVPGEVEAPLVEAVADQFGATQSATFDAPRF